MQTQAELIANAVDDAATGAEAFNAKMLEVFPKFIARAYPRKILGENIEIVFANVADKSECSSGILMNATGYMKFLMQLNDGVNTVAKSFDIELGTWSYHLRNAGLKFRKIKGKTPTEALQKLAAWYEKNAEIIRSV